jgi:3-methyladenine DNA glycosylase Mpg
MKMAIEDKLRQQSVIVSLLASTKLDDAARKMSEEALGNNPKAAQLFSSEPSLEPAKLKLRGKKGISLTTRQSEIVTVVNHLYEFERHISPWIESNPDRVYAVEYVLEHYDAAKNSFDSEGSGASLVKKLSFTELQVLKKYSKYAEKFATMYSPQGLKEDVEYNMHADEVAQSLVGRRIIVPSQPLRSSVEINAWQDYLKGESEGYRPIDALIIEAEGFETSEEVTRSRYCMLAAPGQLDVMPHRGQTLLNVGTYLAGTPSCVMIRSVCVNGEDIEGPGRVGNLFNANLLIGKFLGKDIPLKGITAPSGYIPGSAEYSTGKHRMQ